MKKAVTAALLAAVLASTAWGFEPYFSNAAGQKIGMVWEGQQIYIAIKDPEKGACGIDQFEVDLVVFDFKTGAYLGISPGQTNTVPTDRLIRRAVFRELGGIGSGLYFWVAGPGSSSKVTIQVGSRHDFASIGGQTHVMGNVSPAAITLGIANPDTGWTAGWLEGAWEYVDENVLNATPPGAQTLVTVGVYRLPQDRLTARISFEGFLSGTNTGLGTVWYGPSIKDAGYQRTQGRFENNDTLILIAADRLDERNIDQDQIKIHETVAKLTVPARVDYGCGPSCESIIIRVEDKDENLNCNEIEYVPVFVIINPGSWNSTQTPSVNNFCALMLRGGYNSDRDLINQPIRWYNIYEPERYMLYAGAQWWPATISRQLIRTVIMVPETSVDSGIFEINLGNLEDFQQFLFDGDINARNYRFPQGTTFAFYYIDPNDFDDMTLAVTRLGNRPYSQTFITDANGIPAEEVRIGAGWGGLYIRVYDADANVEACCQDKVVVHICDPHNEDDSEYYILDEISNDSGIFFSQSGIPLLPVWDAVAGYQLVFDDWRVQSFNEDTIFVRYNSVDYVQADLNKLGDGDPNDGAFPPRINTDAARNQYWDVSFAKVKVYDFQVYDGETHHMRFLNGQYQPVTQIPLSGSLYLEVTDLDQNEHPAMRELIFGGWNKDAQALQYGDATVARNYYFGTPLSDAATQDAGEDSAPIWWSGGTVTASPAWGASDKMTPEGALDTTGADDLYLGLLPGDSTSTTYNHDVSITKIPETVKVFMWNAQRGTWERMDLRETAVGSGIFRSTTCVLVADARHPGDGNLASKPGDTIMAFYQDPSNHSDISVISIKVSEGGAGGITPPPVALSVAFDKANYNTGELVTITVTDEQYAGAMAITGTAPLQLKAADGTVLQNWDSIPTVAGQPGKFRVTHQLAAEVTGTITVFYVDPMVTTRSASAQATVAAPVLARVTDVKPVPEVFSSSTSFTAFVEPAGAVVDSLKVTVYDLTGKQVATLTGTVRSNVVTWNGGTLRNGAYVYVAEAVGAGRVWTFKGYVYIKR